MYGKMIICGGFSEEGCPRKVPRKEKGDMESGFRIYFGIPGHLGRSRGTYKTQKEALQASVKLWEQEADASDAEVWIFKGTGKTIDSLVGITSGQTVMRFKDDDGSYTNFPITGEILKRINKSSAITFTSGRAARKQFQEMTSTY